MTGKPNHSALMNSSDVQEITRQRGYQRGYFAGLRAAHGIAKQVHARLGKEGDARAAHGAFEVADAIFTTAFDGEAS